MPSTEATILILLAMAAYAMAAVLNLVTVRMKNQTPGALTISAMACGTALSLAVVVLRVARGHLPAVSGFDTFSVLALLTGAMAAYLWAVNALGRVGLVLMPIATAWAAMAVLLSGSAYHGFAHDAWTVIHVVLAASSALAFAAAAVGGSQYLRKYAQLRSKDPRMFTGPATSLERIGRFLRRSLPIAFALVSATCITGLVNALVDHQTYFSNWVTHPKVLAAGISWLFYAVALHAVYARHFRARVAAILSIAGFFLLFGVLLGAMLMPIR